MSRRIVLITGATRGMGRALVDGFIAGGHTVVGCGRSAREVSALSAMHKAPNRFDVVDVSSAEAVDAWCHSVLTSPGTPDILINNAALMNQLAPLWEVPQQEFDALIAVNLNGVANVIRAFVPSMLPAATGVVINLSSGWGRSASPEVAPYCASKFGVEGLTAALSQELPRGMCAVALSPSTVNTDMLRSCWLESAAQSPSPEQWAQRAVPFILALGAKDNGKSLTCRG